MKQIILLILLIPVLAQAQRYGHTSGSTFYWNKSGEAQKSDSIRYIQGSNITLTQSGNTLTIAGAAGAGSTANVRANTGWTASGTLARDTLYTNYAIFGAKTFGVGGTTQAQNARAKFNVLGRASPDTLAIIGNDGGGLVGDSTITIGPTGKMGIGVIFNPSFSLITGTHISSGGDYYTTGSYRISGSSILSGTNPLLLGGQATTAAISPASSGKVGIGTSGTGQLQAFLTVRPQTPTADTTFMARNDATGALDSTLMVFANGRILRRDTKQLPAGAWLATASNGAALSSSNYMVTYAFDTATAETLTVDFALPPNFMQITSVEIEVISPNTDGDSVGFAIAWLGRAADEAFNVAFSSPLSGQIDLGTTANVRKILTISGTFSNLAASDRLILKLWRDPSIANDVAADVHLVDVRVNGNGLLY